MRKQSDISSKTLVILVILVVLTTAITTWTALNLTAPAPAPQRSTSGAVVLNIEPPVEPQAPATTTGGAP